MFKSGTFFNTHGEFGMVVIIQDYKFEMGRGSNPWLSYVFSSANKANEKENLKMEWYNAH